MMYRFYIHYEDGSKFELIGLSLRDAKAMCRATDKVLGMNPIKRYGWQEMK